MAKLTTRARKNIPSNKFALPESRKYPLNDKAHAANAKARATQMAKKGKISASTESKIKAEANRVIGKTKD